MIGFESDEAYLRKLRGRLQAMGDEELIKFGKYARSLAGIRVSGLSDPYKIKLDEARREWRRRHPKQLWMSSERFTTDEKPARTLTLFATPITSPTGCIA